MFEYKTFETIAGWAVSRAINESSWIFPLVQAFISSRSASWRARC
jgi:hypothetical protein